MPPCGTRSNATDGSLGVADGAAINDDSNAPATIASGSVFIETIIAGHWQRAAAESRPMEAIRMRGILDPMTKRLFAMVVALAVMSAPVARGICQVACESKGTQPSMPHGAAEHAAHHQMPADHAACHGHGEVPEQLSPLDGSCDH